MNEQHSSKLCRVLWGAVRQTARKYSCPKYQALHWHSFSASHTFLPFLQYSHSCNIFQQKGRKEVSNNRSLYGCLDAWSVRRILGRPQWQFTPPEFQCPICSNLLRQPIELTTCRTYVCAYLRLCVMSGLSRCLVHAAIRWSGPPSWHIPMTLFDGSQKHGL